MKFAALATVAAVVASPAFAQAVPAEALSAPPTPVEKRIFSSDIDAAVDVFRVLTATLTQFGEAPRFSAFCARQGFAVVTATGNDGGHAYATIDFLPDGKFAVRAGAPREFAALSDDQCR